MESFDDLTNRKGLLLMFGMASYLEMRVSLDGTLYHPSTLKKKSCLGNWDHFNLRDHQPLKSSHSLWRNPKCHYLCNGDNPIPKVSDGDHLVAEKAAPGADLAAYTVPSCLDCNKSKGNKELPEWWIKDNGRDFCDFPFELVSQYVRAKNRCHQESPYYCTKNGELDDPISSDSFKKALQHLFQKILSELDDSKREHEATEIITDFCRAHTMGEPSLSFN